ncbi:exocyst complex component 8-like [Uloborus diversus]|uniref:exocyst complex component 8-like n=1 Tax=Uloborus diversus TaxID=327109 RepID=UPI0024096716|nr:exocyst complex component 8-like [Uloborus diversus]
MANNLASQLIKEEFNPLDYVKKQVTECNGAVDLLSERERIHKLAEETNGLLKKNVYKNYTQFIETAKEISYLEGEMYQLSHMLAEQQTVLNSLLEVSIAASKDSELKISRDKETDEENNKNLSLLLEKVEGCATILEVRGRTVVYNGEMLELGVNDYKPIHTVYCVLLDDGLMFATKIENSRGPLQYRYQALYELDGLAVVNVKEEIGVKNVFKVLMFPEVRHFQCLSATSKKEWLSRIDQAKKKKLSSFERLSSPKEAPNPFEDEGANPFEENLSPHRNAYLETPIWLLELPEELDVCIALREFEKAVQLIQKASAHCAAFPRSTAVKDTKIRIDNRAKQLVHILTEELKVSPDRSLHGGPRAARKAVGVLIQLGKSSKACNLFLKRCSAMLKQNMKQQKAEGATLSYIEKLCSVFFSCIADTGKEFNRAFENNACASAFVLWAKLQLEQFVQIFSKHVFTPQVSASTATDCIACARQHCDKLSDVGLEFSFVLNDLLSSQVERLVTEMRDKLLEAIKLRSNDDKWRPQNLQNTTNSKKLLDDLREMGIDNAESYLFDECWLTLTINITAFAKMYLNFLDDLLKLYTPAVHTLINEALSVAFQTQLFHVKNAFQKANDPSERQFISKNASFLSDVLKILESRYSQRLSRPCTVISDFQEELSRLVANSFKTSFTKYSSTAYI